MAIPGKKPIRSWILKTNPVDFGIENAVAESAVAVAPKAELKAEDWDSATDENPIQVHQNEIEHCFHLQTMSAAAVVEKSAE